jgi:hypothetical protein
LCSQASPLLSLRHWFGEVWIVIPRAPNKVLFSFAGFCLVLVFGLFCSTGEWTEGLAQSALPLEPCLPVHFALVLFCRLGLVLTFA